MTDLTTTTAPSPPPQSTPTPAPSGEVSTFGWDTAFAVRIENVNAAIAARKMSPTSFTYVDPQDPETHCSGSFGDWQIVRGGDGPAVLVELPMSGVTGRAKGRDGYSDYTWAGGSFTYAIRLEFFDAGVDATTGNRSMQLKAKPTSDTPTVPVVEFQSSSISTMPDPAWTVYAIEAAVTAWATANLADFAYIFSVADLNDEADKGEWHFLKPTTVSYSYVDGDSDEDAFLGVLAMTTGRSAAGLQQVIDKRIVQGTEEGAFCISRTLLLEQLIQPNLLTLWPNMTADQLTVAEQSLSLKPNESVDLPQVEHQGTWYTPQLQEFSVTIEGAQVTLDAYTITQVQDGVQAWARTTARYTLTKGVNKQGQTTLAFEKYGPDPNPQVSHGHNIAEWVKITDAILAVVLAIALAALAIVTEGAAVPIIAVIGALIVGAIALAPTIEGLIINGDAPAISLLAANVYAPMVWTDSKDFEVQTVDLDGALRLGGALGFGVT